MIMTRASAGILAPTDTSITSPGTSSVAGMLLQCPSRSTVAASASYALSSSIALSAFVSVKTPTVAVDFTKTRTWEVGGRSVALTTVSHAFHNPIVIIPLAIRIRMMTAGSTKAPAPSPPATAIAKSTNAARIRICSVDTTHTSSQAHSAANQRRRNPIAAHLDKQIIKLLQDQLPEGLPCKQGSVVGPDQRRPHHRQACNIHQDEPLPIRSMYSRPITLTRFCSEFIGPIQRLGREQLCSTQSMIQTHSKVRGHLYIQNDSSG